MNQIVNIADHRMQIADLKKQLDGCDNETALEMCRYLFGCYPKARADDTEVYAKMVRGLFLKYSRDVCLKAIDEVTKKSDWLPTRKKLFEALEAAAKPIHDDISKLDAQIKLERIRQQNKAEQEQKLKEAAEREAFKKRFYDEHGMTPFDHLRKQINQNTADKTLATKEKENEKTSTENPN